MNDDQLLRLYETRDDRASAETYRAYGGVCRGIAMRILGNREDAEECVNDVLLRLWNSIPPAKPQNLRAYVAAAARNIACSRYVHDHAKTRGGTALPAVLDELGGCVSGTETLEEIVDRRSLAAALDRFLAGLKPETRIIFVQRYWYCCTPAEIAAEAGVTVSKVNVTLMRTRRKLAAYLKKEGFQ